MDKQFMILCDAGKTPPKYIHHDYALAVEEAKRLTTLTGSKCIILQIVGVVQYREVPVTTRKLVFDSLTDELPF